MDCPCCGHDNLPGADRCEICLSSMSKIDSPLAQIRSMIAKTLNEDTVEELEPLRDVFIQEAATVEEAVRAMREKKTGCLLVTDAEGNLTGILSDRTLMNFVALEEPDLASLTVGEVKRPDADPLRPHHLIAHALHRLIVGDRRYLALADAEGRPVGVVTTNAIIRHLTTVTGVCT